MASSIPRDVLHRFAATQTQAFLPSVSFVHPYQRKKDSRCCTTRMRRRCDAHGVEYITLESFLKMQGVVETGGRAKLMITSGMVSVNGEMDNRRGRKLRQGDVVRMEGLRMEVQFREEGADGEDDEDDTV